MPRKFFTLIAASAIALTGFSAAPARADNGEVGNFLAGLAALAIIGAAIEDSHDRHTTVIQKRQVVIQRPRPPRQVYVQPPRREVHVYPRREVYVHPRREVHVYPPKVIRHVSSNSLPGHCLRQYPGRGALLSGACLRRQGNAPRALPRACQIGIDSGRGSGGVAYEPGCLRQNGYHLGQR